MSETSDIASIFTHEFFGLEGYVQGWKALGTAMKRYQYETM